MKKYIPIIAILFFATSASAAIYAFTSQQLAPSPVNGYILQTNGSKNAWVDSSTITGSWATTSTNYWLTTKTTDNLTEGPTNLYDKTVTFVNGTNVSMLGTYPNFTISDSLTPNFTTLTVTGTSTTGVLCFDVLGIDCMASSVANTTDITLYHWNGASDIAGYEQFRTKPDGGTEIIESCTATAGYCAAPIDSYVSSSTAPNGGLSITSIPAGLWKFNYFGYVSTASGNTYFVVDMYRRIGASETLLFTATSSAINNTSIAQIDFSTTQGAFAFDPTDRLVAKVRMYTDHAAPVTLYFAYDGNTHYSHIETPINISVFGYLRASDNATITGNWTHTASTTFAHLNALTASTTLITSIGGMYLGNGLDAVQPIITINNASNPHPYIEYDNNFMGSGYSGASWVSSSGKSAFSSRSEDDTASIVSWSKALDKEVSFMLMNTTNTTDGTSWLLTKRADVSDNLVFEFGDFSPVSSLETLSITPAGLLTFLYASSTAISGDSLCIGTDCRTAWPVSGAASTTLLSDNNTFSGQMNFGNASGTNLTLSNKLYLTQGVDKQVQFNDGGFLGYSSNFTFDKTLNELYVSSPADESTTTLNAFGIYGSKRGLYGGVPYFSSANGEFEIGIRNESYVDDGDPYPTITINQDTGIIINSDGLPITVSDGAFTVSTTTATSTFPWLSSTRFRIASALDFFGTTATSWSTFVDQIIVTLKTKLIGPWDFGGADSLEVPNGASVTVDAIGEVGVQTSPAAHLRVATSTNASYPMILNSGAFRMKFATSTATSTNEYETLDFKERVGAGYCRVTGVASYIRVGNGTTYSTTVALGANATTSVAFDYNLFANNGERIVFETGSPSGFANVYCSFRKTLEL